MSPIITLRRAVRRYGIAQTARFASAELWQRVFRGPLMKSYSQMGEDIVINKHISKRRGFYIDVGANDPYRFSNSARFWRKGWSGITIEPDPVLHQKIANVRSKNTVNLNAGVAKRPGHLKFYKFEPDTLSTFSKEEKVKYLAEGYKYKGVEKVPVMTLANVIIKYTKGKKIDLLSIDTEGFDLEVLESNDWKKYKPTVICIEAVEHTSAHAGLTQRKQDKLLRAQGYQKVFENKLNAIYKIM